MPDDPNPEATTEEPAPEAITESVPEPVPEPVPPPPARPVGDIQADINAAKAKKAQGDSLAEEGASELASLKKEWDSAIAAVEADFQSVWNDIAQFFQKL